MLGFKNETLGDEGMLERVKATREIQEAKINLIKMLSEAKTEAQISEILRIKEQFMATLREPKQNRPVEMRIQEEEVKNAELDLIDAIDDTMIAVLPDQKENKQLRIRNISDINLDLVMLFSSGRYDLGALSSEENLSAIITPATGTISGLSQSGYTSMLGQ